MTKILTDREALITVGRSIYGPFWAPALARQLAAVEGRDRAYSASYVSKMRDGRNKVPGWVRPMLGNLLRREIEVRQQLLTTIRFDEDQEIEQIAG